MLRFLVMVLSLVVLFGRSVSAQPPEALEQKAGTIVDPGTGRNGRGALLINLIAMPAVQEELKLTEPQKKKLAQLDQDLRSSSSRRMAEIQKQVAEAPAENREARLQARRETNRLRFEAAAAMWAEGEKGISKTLEPRQRTRLKQIKLQADGPLAFTQPELLDRLNVAEDQRALIQAIVEEGRRQMIGATIVSAPLPIEKSQAGSVENATTKAFREEVAKNQGTAADARVGTLQKIARVLSKKQRENYLKMLGEPFDLSKLRAATGP